MSTRTRSLYLKIKYVSFSILQIPINQCPFAKVQTYSRDGFMTVNNNGGSKPNYYPNSFEDLPRPDPHTPDVHPYK